MSETASKTIAMACDHGGIELKSILADELKSQGYEVLDLGTNSSESVDYPDFAYALAHAIQDEKTATRGILICGSSIGICMAANRFPAIRAAQIHDALGARLCREHNDANVIAFGARVIGVETARDCLNTFLNTEFEGGRHQGRVDKLSNPK